MFPAMFNSQKPQTPHSACDRLRLNIFLCYGILTPAKHAGDAFGKTVPYTALLRYSVPPYSALAYFAMKGDDRTLTKVKVKRDFRQIANSNYLRIFTPYMMYHDHIGRVNGPSDAIFNLLCA
ncbi:hypothetical protein LPB41_19675 [Thalassospira sp. MA62]|nr:hypothetical protein [Thalassospira sp. MA62]